jgi:hypothetical protein
MDTARLDHLIRFYSILNRLEQNSGGARKLVDCSGRMSWPVRGVYFFRELGEQRSDTGTGLRVVRVGTHAITEGSRTKLWSRLSAHKGQDKTGGGNHRGSVFRKLIGMALIRRNSFDFPTWGNGKTAERAIRQSEFKLEREVSRAIREMPFICLAVVDQVGSQRSYIERNAIALLSNFRKHPLDPPSEGWLGHLCGQDRVTQSGLWNRNHVHEEYDAAFLDTLDALAAGTRRKE